MTTDPAVTAEKAPADNAPPENAPPESAPPESAPPESAPPESAPPEKVTPETVTPEKVTAEKAPDNEPADNALSADNAPADNAPADNAPADNAPPDNAPPDNAPPDNAPPDNAAPAINALAASLSTEGFLAELGMQLGEITADRAEMTVPVTPRLHQPQGIVHGGVYCAMVETLASLGAAVWFGDRGNVVGVSNHTDFLRAARAGTLHGVATPIHRGRTQQLWLVEIADDAGRAIARGQVRLANITSTDQLAAR